MKKSRIDRTGSDLERFEEAACRFLRECADQCAHEAAYQGWLTAFLADEFGWGRVYREVHVQAPDLLAHAPTWDLVQQEFGWRKEQAKGSLNLDVSVAMRDGLDCRKSQTRGPDVAGTQILRKLCAVAELKVCGAVADPRAQRAAVWRDMAKLGLYSAAAADRQVSRPLGAYLLILDNFRTGTGAAWTIHPRELVDGVLRGLRDAWAGGVAVPVVMIGRSAGEGVAVDVYREFVFERTAS